MEIRTNIDGDTASIAIVGKLSVATVPELEEAIENCSTDVIHFIMELDEMEYISSAGLRVFVSIEKLSQGRGGDMVLRHPNEEVSEVLEMTGLSDVFTIED